RDPDDPLDPAVSLKKGHQPEPERSRGSRHRNCQSRFSHGTCLPRSAGAEAMQSPTRRTSGGGGIRTLGAGVARTTVFETAPFNHSGTPPRAGRAVQTGRARLARRTAPSSARSWLPSPQMRSFASLVIVSASLLLAA